MQFLILSMFLLFASRLVKTESPYTCRSSCPTRNIRPVCGTDLKTYPSRCHLQQEKCRGYKVRMIYRGKCRVSQSPCVQEKQNAIKAIKKRELLQIGVFVPRCNPDGSFTPVQCLKARNVCWCVDPLGKEIAGTRTRLRTPVCPSPSTKSSGRSQWKPNRHNFKGCPKNVRTTFNKKVINLLERQFIEHMGKSASARIPDLGNVHILTWKFNQLDDNADYFINLREIHELLRLTKKTIHPKKCSKTFVDYCDENADNRISRNEWYACFGVKEIKKCIGEYLTAVKQSQNSPAGSHFLPKCQGDGSYHPTQCHNGIGYCWCADVNTGKPIPGSTAKTNSLDCRKYVSKYGGSGSRRKGGRKECSRDLLPAFARQVLHLFRKEVTTKQIDDNGMSSDLDDSLIRIQRKARSGNLNLWGAFLSDNQVLAWKFHQLDTNKNRILTSSEYFIPAMKKALGKVKRGRRCSRKLISECDFDKNGGLSVDEWSYCLLDKFLRS